MRAVVVLASVALVACTFPDVQFGDASVPIDTGTDVVVVNEAGTDANDPCDKDHDGFKAEGSCGGNDCNDDDPRVNPGVKNPVYDEPDAAPFGDWNCDGKVVPDYPFIACGLNTCNAQTFTTNTGCGITNPFVTCNAAVTCAGTDAGTKTQGCL